MTKICKHEISWPINSMISRAVMFIWYCHKRELFRLIQFEYNEWFILLIYKECCYSHHKKRLNPIFPNLYFCVFSHFYSVFHTFCCKTRKVVTCSVWLFFFVRCVHCASGIFETINRSFRVLLEFKSKWMILVISHLFG